MKTEKLVIRVLVLLLVAGAAGVSAFVLDMGAMGVPAHGLSELSLAGPGWQQVNSNGFGDPQTGEVTALAAFNGYLYAGTHNPIDPAPLYDGTQIFRSSDGLAWTSVINPGFGITHDIAPPAILDFIVFNNRLYASTGRGDGPGQIWRSLNGITWAPMVIHGFGDPDTVNITALGVYNGVIYAGATNQNSGVQIWRSTTGDNNTWTQATVPASVDTRISAFAEFGGVLYAAVESAGPAQLWFSYGGNWTAAVTNGFGNSNTTLTGGMAEFGGYLYVGAGNTVNGGQLWRSNDGTNWAQAITPGFGDANNQKVEMVFVFQNRLYVSVGNATTGIEVWRSADGSQWEQANQDGFADSNNTGTNWSNATAEFLGKLYVGTSNIITGGELWQFTPQVTPVYGVNLSPNDASAGPPGSTVNYSLTISNTGNITDTFDLVATGHTWTTTLSTSQVAGLGPSASKTFTATVSIPAGAADQASDAVTITATSQGDGSKTDSATLTTTSISAPVYGVVLSADASLSGLPGKTVTYTLTITNSSSVADVFDLSATGQTWTTNLSTSQVSLASLGSTTFMAIVTIPPGAADQDSDTVTVTATSQGDGSKTDSATLTTTCVVSPVYGVLLSADASLSGLPGKTVTYTLTITNSSNVADSFSLATSGNSWATLLSATAVALPSHGTSTFTAAVSVPAGALATESDTVAITATSQGDAAKNDSATLTTTATAFYGLVVSPNQAVSAKFGQTVTYTLWISNTGNADDTFDVTASDHAWTTTVLTPSVNLPAGSSGAILVTVAVPTGALPGARDTAVISIKSRGDPSQEASAILITAIPKHETYLPSIARAP